MTETSYNKYLPFIICGLAALFYPYEFMVRVMPSAITNELMATFNIGAAKLGILSSLFYLGYVSMQIPAGMLFDRFGPRLLLSSAMLMCSLGTLWFGLTDDYYAALVARFVIGFGSSFAFIGTLVLASRWFPAKYFALIAGLVQFLGSIGALIGEQPVAELVKHYSWQSTVYWTALIGILIAVMMFLLIRNHPTASPKRRKERQQAHGVEPKTFRVVYTNPQTWWIALFAFASWAPIVIFAALWGIPFLMVLYNTSASDAASGLSVLWIGVAIGSPLVGWWSSRIGSRRLPLAVCAAIGVVSSVVVIYAGVLPWWLMYIMLFLFGFAASSQALSFGLVQDINPPGVAGSAIGLNNMAVILSGIICQPLVGYLLKYTWSGEMSAGVPIYSLASYRAALWLVPLISIIGLVTVLVKVKETHCEQVYPNIADENAAAEDEKEYFVSQQSAG